MQIGLQPYFKITLYSHFFKITHIAPSMSNLIYVFYMKWAQKDWVRERGRKPHLEVKKVYASRNDFGREFRFHIGQSNEFVRYLEANGIKRDFYIIESAESYTPAKIQLKVKTTKQPRDKQPEAIQFALEKATALDNYSRLIAMPTGTGKTFVGLTAISKMQERVLVPILPKYIDKWISDIKEYYYVEDEDIAVIKGCDSFLNVIQEAKENKLKAKFIIVSLVTYRNIIEDFEKNPCSWDDLGFDIELEDICRILKIGIVLSDESHQHLFSLFKLTLYMNVPLLLSLTATLLSNDPFILRIQRIMFPREIRFEEVKMKKYIRAYAVSYRFEDIKKSRIRSTEWGSNTYSHNAFEKSILNNGKVKRNYFAMIDKLLQIGYLDDYVKGDKAVVFVSTIHMATELTNYLKQKQPKLDIRRYVEDDPYENVIDADIRVTTTISGGTAVDIPGLVCSIQTISIASPQSNIQVLGRLREINNRTCRFYYIWSENIPKQRQFHRMRMELFADRVASIKEFRLPNLI